MASWKRLWMILGCIAISVIILKEAQGIILTNKTGEEKLRDAIFGSGRNFSKFLPKFKNRPIDPLKVEFSAFIHSVKEVLENDEEISLRIQLTMQWQNELIKWNQSDYDGTHHLRLKIDEIWSPSISVLEEVDENFIDDDRKQLIVHLESSGLVYMVYKANVKVGCSMNACLFPNDNYTCKITFVAPGYNASELDLSPVNGKSYENRLFSSSGIWNFQWNDGKKITVTKVNSFEGSTLLLSGVGYVFTVQRKALFFYLTIFFPIALICIVVFFGALLPSDSSDRISLLITCLLAEVFYLDSSFQVLPKSSDYIPVIIIYIYLILLFTAVQIFLSCVTSHLAGRERQKRKVTGLLKLVLLDFLAKIFSCRLLYRKRPKIVDEDSPIIRSNSSNMNVLNEDRDKQEIGLVEMKAKDISSTDQESSSKEHKIKRKDEPVKKECRKARSAVNGFSNLLSILIVLSVPLFFYIVYFSKFQASDICKRITK